MKKKTNNTINKKITIFLILIFIVGFVILLKLVVLGGFSPLSGYTNANPTHSVSEDMKTVHLPVSVNNSNTLFALVEYFFQAPVKNITKMDNGYKVTLDTSDKDIPNFVVTNKARILELSDDSSSNVGGPPQTVPGNMEDVQKGSIVQIGVNYDLKSMVWTVAGLTIVRK